MKVLLVDTKIESRKILMNYFGSWGARVEENDTAKGALQRLRQAGNTEDPFHIVFLDMDMPKMNGIALGETIFSDQSIPKVQMALMHKTGYQEKVQGLIGLRFSTFLAKPFRYSGIMACMDKLFTGKRPQRKMGIDSSSTMRGDVVKKRILLAEDNSVNQQVVIGILKKIGYTNIDAVANGLEAVQALEEFPYSLVLMDVQMPEMDGVEATRRIRDKSSRVMNHDIPIIALTAHAMAGDRDKYLKVGMNDYIAKPIAPDSLINVLRTYLKGRQQTESERLF